MTYNQSDWLQSIVKNPNYQKPTWCRCNNSLLELIKNNKIKLGEAFIYKSSDNFRLAMKKSDEATNKDFFWHKEPFEEYLDGLSVTDSQDVFISENSNEIKTCGIDHWVTTKYHNMEQQGTYKVQPQLKYTYTSKKFDFANVNDCLFEFENFANNNHFLKYDDSQAFCDLTPNKTTIVIISSKKALINNVQVSYKKEITNNFKFISIDDEQYFDSIIFRHFQDFFTKV